MNTRYLPSVLFNGEKIIPSDIFELGGNRYLLLDISQNTGTKEVYLHLIGLRGRHMAQEFTFGLNELESSHDALANF